MGFCRDRPCACLAFRVDAEQHMLHPSELCTQAKSPEELQAETLTNGARDFTMNLRDKNRSDPYKTPQSLSRGCEVSGCLHLSDSMRRSVQRCSHSGLGAQLSPLRSQQPSRLAPKAALGSRRPPMPPLRSPFPVCSSPFSRLARWHQGWGFQRAADAGTSRP